MSIYTSWFLPGFTLPFSNPTPIHFRTFPISFQKLSHHILFPYFSRPNSFPFPSKPFPITFQSIFYLSTLLSHHFLILLFLIVSYHFPISIPSLSDNFSRSDYKKIIDLVYTPGFPDPHLRDPKLVKPTCTL